MLRINSKQGIHHAFDVFKHAQIGSFVVCADRPSVRYAGAQSNHLGTSIVPGLAFCKPARQQPG